MRAVRKISDIDQACISFFMEIKKLFQNNEAVIIALSGGSSMRKFFQKISNRSSMLTNDEWKNLHFFWVDERLVPLNDAESNYKLAMDLFLKELLGKNLISDDNIHRFPGESETPVISAKEYNSELQKMGKINIAILGVGPDGHTASLFPNHPLLDYNAREFLVIEDSPKPPLKRMTMSPNQIIEADVNFVFFIGESKRNSYEKFNNPEVDYHDCPVLLSLEGEGICYVVTDLE